VREGELQQAIVLLRTWLGLAYRSASSLATWTGANASIQPP
jgi:hypothetical protein